MKLAHLVTIWIIFHLILLKFIIEISDLPQLIPHCEIHLQIRVSHETVRIWKWRLFLLTSSKNLEFLYALNVNDPISWYHCAINHVLCEHTNTLVAEISLDLYYNIWLQNQSVFQQLFPAKALIQKSILIIC